MDGLPPETVTPNDPAQTAAAEKRDLLARLLGRLAHEIRNPLSSLDIHVQLLQEDLAALPNETNESAEAHRILNEGAFHSIQFFSCLCISHVGATLAEAREST